MTSAVDDSFHAGIAVRELWGALSSKSFDREAASPIRQILDTTKSQFKLSKETSDEDVLAKLKKTLLLASSHQTARPAVLGVATVLGDIGTIGGVDASSDALMKTAREVRSAVFLALTSSPLSRLILKLQNSISEEFIAASLFPPRYRRAIELIRFEAEKAQKQGPEAQVSDMVGVGSAIYSLRSLLEPFKGKPAALSEKSLLLKEACDYFLSMMNRVEPRFLKALELNEKATDLFNKVQVFSSGTKPLAAQEVKKLEASLRLIEKSVSPLVTDGILPPSLLTCIHADRAYCLAQGSYSQGGIRSIKNTDRGGIQEICRLVKSIEIPSRYRRAILADNRENTELLDLLGEVRELVHKNDLIPPGYDESVSLLEELHSKKRDKKSLTAEEGRSLNYFLHFALENKNLNALLWNKEERSPIEELLCSFTYITSQASGATGQIDKVSTKLQFLGVTGFLNTCRELDKYINESEGKYAKSSLYTSLMKLKKKASRKDLPDFESNFSVLFPLTHVGVSLGTQSTRAARFSPEHAQAVAWMKAFAETKGTEKVLGALNAYEGLLQTATKLRTTLMQNALTAKAAVAFSDLRAIEQFSDVDRLLCLVPEETLGKELTTLKECSVTALSVGRDLDYALQSLPGYEPGDIVFDHEKKLKLFNQKGETVTIYSEKKKSLLEVAKDAVTRGIFCVQPYFTGPLSHVGIVLFQPDKDGTTLVSRADIAYAGYQTRPFTMLDSAVSQTLRPKWDAMLTPEAKVKLGPFFQTTLTQRYSGLLADFVRRNRSELGKIQSDPYKASRAFTDTLPPPFKSMFDRYIRSFVHVSSPKQLEGDELATLFSTEMFCSEFVGAVMIKILQELNEQLSKELDIAKVFQEEAFIHPDELPTLHPDKLAEKIQGFYTSPPPPVITALLLGKDGS